MTDNPTTAAGRDMLANAMGLDAKMERRHVRQDILAIEAEARIYSAAVHGDHCEDGILHNAGPFTIASPAFREALAAAGSPSTSAPLTTEQT